MNVISFNCDCNEPVAFSEPTNIHRSVFNWVPLSAGELCCALRISHLAKNLTCHVAVHVASSSWDHSAQPYYTSGRTEQNPAEILQFKIARTKKKVNEECSLQDCASLSLSGTGIGRRKHTSQCLPAHGPISGENGAQRWNNPASVGCRCLIRSDKLLSFLIYSLTSWRHERKRAESRSLPECATLISVVSGGVSLLFPATKSAIVVNFMMVWLMVKIHGQEGGKDLRFLNRCLNRRHWSVWRESLAGFGKLYTVGFSVHCALPVGLERFILYVCYQWGNY